MAVDEPVDAALQRAQRLLRPYRGVLSFAFGLVAVFRGREFTYSILFVRVFGAMGWPVVRRAAIELHESYRAARLQAAASNLPSFDEARQAALAAVNRLGSVRSAYADAQAAGDRAGMVRLQEEMAGLQGELEALGAVSAPLGSIITAAEPAKLLDLARSLYDGLVDCLVAATSAGAAKLGVGVNIGNVVAETIRGWIAPRVQPYLEHAAEKVGGEVYAQ